MWCATKGQTLVQSFHDSIAQRGGKFDAILADICAFANTAGGAVYVGAKPRKDKPVKGLPNAGAGGAGDPQGD